jgi:hypothetical protein
VAEALRAYKVETRNGDYGHVVFGASRGQARVEGASRLEAEFLEVEVERAAQFDSYAPGPVPLHALLADGWYHECGNCQHQVYEDGCFECSDGEEQSGPVFSESGQEVYCSDQCRDADEIRTLSLRVWTSNARALTLSRYPGAEILTITGVVAPIVRFTFPGGLYPACFDMEGQCARVVEEDFEAWEAFTSKPVVRLEKNGTEQGEGSNA